MITANELVAGLDCSNWQGEFSSVTTDAIRANGYRYCIVRLSIEDTPRWEISRQQCAALRAAGIPVLGYAWCYWDRDPAGLAMVTIQLAEQCGVSIVALDAEDPIQGPQSASAYLNTAADELLRADIIPIGYTYTYWPSSYHQDLSGCGNLPWWMANLNGRPDLTHLAPYPGAHVIGHQWSEWESPDGKEFDVDVFTFDARLAGRLNGQIEDTMDEETVRRIVREELNAVSMAANEAPSFATWATAVTRRIGAAGVALDLSRPVPELPSPTP